MYIFQSMVVAIALCTHYMPIMLDFQPFRQYLVSSTMVFSWSLFFNDVVSFFNSLTRANVLVRGSLNGLLGKMCGITTEYCLISILLVVQSCLIGQSFLILNSVVTRCNLLTRANVLVRGSLNGLLGEICGVATEYCLISCFVCVSASTAAQEAALLCQE